MLSNREDLLPTFPESLLQVKNFHSESESHTPVLTPIAGLAPQGSSWFCLQRGETSACKSSSSQTLKFLASFIQTGLSFLSSFYITSTLKTAANDSQKQLLRFHLETIHLWQRLGSFGAPKGQYKSQFNFGEHLQSWEPKVCKNKPKFASETHMAQKKNQNSCHLGLHVECCQILSQKHKYLSPGISQTVQPNVHPYIIWATMDLSSKRFAYYPPSITPKDMLV